MTCLSGKPVSSFEQSNPTPFYPTPPHHRHSREGGREQSDRRSKSRQHNQQGYLTAGVTTSVKAEINFIGHSSIRAFDELVAVLWVRGDNGATVRLEYLWQELCLSKRSRSSAPTPRSASPRMRLLPLRRSATCTPGWSAGRTCLSPATRTPPDRARAAAPRRENTLQRPPRRRGTISRKGLTAHLHNAGGLSCFYRQEDPAAQLARRSARSRFTV